MTEKAASSSQLFSIILSLAGLLILVEGWKLLAQVKECSRWSEIDAQVQSSKVSETSASKKRYRADITYTYTVRGDTHTSHQVLLDRDWKAQRKSHVLELLQDYPVGKTVKAYHDPNNSGNAILIRPNITGVYVLFGAGSVFLGGGIYFVVWHLRRRARMVIPAT
ncbi:DUF3592 domain-containing protein [Roseimicrobium sp. ORNL1]|uniref:DUF3592 domain-containing protein n=1 Tax=Roseimicrobium sp. ORNL1 TaxID=2711231 RepID=UPI0013E179BB|nr:DUF3592 domain-containing protein [Roseimicrobium sp. ORNL1]QIF01472.1 DUF3592 domain-containing protein [Roseimicrobium sp. ORNL1]